MSKAIDPTKFWPQILESIANGESLSSAINRKGFPSYSWCKSALRQNPELRRQYEQAVLARCDWLADELVELGTLTGAAFDSAWAAAMIAHHEGAIEMAEAVLADGKNAETLALAQAIISAQQTEIETLRSL